MWVGQNLCWYHQGHFETRIWLRFLGRWCCSICSRSFSVPAVTGTSHYEWHGMAAQQEGSTSSITPSKGSLVRESVAQLLLKADRNFTQHNFWHCPANLSLPEDWICCWQWTVTSPSGKTCRSTKHFRFLNLWCCVEYPCFQLLCLLLLTAGCGGGELHRLQNLKVLKAPELAPRHPTKPALLQ